MDKALDYVGQIWNHEGFQKYFRNTSWMLAARIISFITSFFTIAIVARYLGPENLGKLEYAQSFVAIISVFASLGIDQILYRELISEKEKQNDLLGTAFLSKLIFGVLALVVSILISISLKDDIVLTVLIGIIALTFVINPIGTIGILFNSQVKAKYSAQIAIFLAFFIPALKLLVIYADKGIIYFSTIILIEALVSVSWSSYIYITKFNGNFILWKFSYKTFKKLMHDSWPLLLAGLSGYIYAKMDQIMLMHYLDSVAVGLYGAAVKLTQIWAFIPGMIISSLFPAIINAKKESLKKYIERLRYLFFISMGTSLIIALPLFIFATPIIKIIFGDAFLEATPILYIYLWISIAITLVVLVQHYLIAENLSKIVFYTGLIGGITNVILNLILIPDLGSQGAALATLVSYFSVPISMLFFKKSRDSMMNLLKNI